MSLSAEEAAALRKKGGGSNPFGPPPPAASEPETPQAAPPAAESAPGESASAETVAETAPAEPSTGDVTSPADEPAPISQEKPARNSASARIQELVEERNALRAYGRHLEQTLAEQRGKPAATAPAPAPVSADDPPPTLEQHAFDTKKHAEAQAAWVQRQVDKRVTEKVEAVTRQQQQQTAKQQFESRLEAFRATHDDFDLVISNPNLPSLHERAVATVIHSEKGPELAYQLAKNPDLAVRIARMAPDQQLMALGRLEAQLSTPPAPASSQKTPTRAPAPPRPVPSGAGPGKDPNAPSSSMSEFVAAHRERLKARRRMR